MFLVPSGTGGVSRCDRNSEECRVVIATARGAAFMEPLLVIGLTSFHREDAAWSGGNVVRASFFAFFAKVVVVLLDSTVVCTCLVERQLDLSSVAARLRGGPMWFVRVRSFPTEPVTREAHPYLLPGIVMAERRDVGGGGEGAGEDPTQRMIERIWESLTEIRIQQMKREQFRTLQQGNLSVLEYQMRFIALSRSRNSFKEVVVEACNRVFSRAVVTGHQFQRNPSRVRQDSRRYLQVLDVIIVGIQDI
ncbi:hypothetical protein Taro_030076 [Colocasia esculenta]|uniref:Retrotransposon gag domain-containing protein n=1 Tax=Colocasia esculenta TaxID=4460 RepID=A0A843VZ44_COLES|nr:hypothetical protein [Colocasia esculenta]